MSDVISDLAAFLGDDVVVEMPTNEEVIEEVVEDDIEDVIEDEDEVEIDDEDVLDEEDIDEEDDFDEEDMEDLDEEDEEEEVEDDTDDTPEEFELTIEGELVKVTKEELTSGYLRNRDYLAKVADAEERITKLKQEEETLMKSQEVFAFASIKQLEECNKAIEAEGGWLNIERSRDPVQVAQFKEMYQNIQNQAKMAESVQAEFQAQQEKSFEADMTAVAKHLIKTVPNMTTETFTELDNYIAEVGISQEYAKTIRNPIAWSLIHKAMMYDKAQVRKAEAPEKAPKRVKKPVATRKEQVTQSSRRSLDKKVNALSKARSNKERNSELARDAIADLLRMG